VVDFDLSPPASLNLPLWRSLVLNLADRISPERLPPLELTSTPVETGMLFGDRLALPWYRTVFTNIADVVSPDTGPPLELTSRPVDVGELLGDDLSHGWWTSLLDNLRDRLTPEKPVPLVLTSQPLAAYGAKSWLQLMDWSSLLSSPKVFLPDASSTEVRFTAAEQAAELGAIPAIAAAVPASQELWAVQMQFKRDLSRSRFRQKIWMTLVAAEAVFLLAYLFNIHW
jgi:hypothetical protein